MSRFLTSLAVEGGVGPSTQNQALAALLLLYREVLRVDLPWLDEWCAPRSPIVYPWSFPGTRCVPSWCDSTGSIG